MKKLAIENAEAFKALGGESYSYIPALNSREDHLRLLNSLLQANLDAFDTDTCPLTCPRFFTPCYKSKLFRLLHFSKTVRSFGMWTLKEAILIDAGGEPEKLKAEVEALGLTVKALWLTHGHLDHAGAVGALKKAWNVPVIGPHKEVHSGLT